MQPVAAHAAGEAVPPWTCRECCARTGRSYCYPDYADSYCIACGGAMSDVERLAVVVRGLVQARVFVPPAPAVRPSPEFLTVDETAELLRATPGAIRARAARGKVPGLVRDGRRLLVRRDALLRALERRAPSPGRSR
jgi:excisionase family DNA binding protein